MIHSIEKLLTIKYLCETKTLDFTRYFYKERFARKFVIGEHHTQIANALDLVIAGKIKKLIINIAPRYGKTELAVKNFMAKGLAINPSSRFIHLSYSDDLALDNSEEVKDIVKCPEYQAMFPNVQIKPGSDSKKKWYTTAGGGVYATAAAGQVTGFGAGQVDIESDDNDDDLDFINSDGTIFSGALIIDDPIKPDDADSETKRERINNRWDSTIKNRVNSRNTPIIIIMQRLHPEDLCGYLINQSPEDWTVLSFPAIKPDGTALWEFKHTIEELRKLEKQNSVVFGRQYMQDPQPLEGLLFKKNEIKRYTRSQFESETKDLTGKSKVEAKYGAVDPAEGGGDELSAIFSSIIPKKVFITDVMYTLDTVDLTVPKCVSIIRNKNITYTRVEKNGLGSGYIRDLRKLISPERILSIRHETHKGTRIWNEYGFIKEYFYFLDESEYLPGSEYDKFMKNLFSYLKDKDNQKDAAPDVSAMLSKMIQSFIPGLFN